jgi:hypothetical protein
VTVCLYFLSPSLSPSLFPVLRVVLLFLVFTSFLRNRVPAYLFLVWSATQGTQPMGEIRFNIITGVEEAIGKNKKHHYFFKINVNTERDHYLIVAPTSERMHEWIEVGVVMCLLCVSIGSP